MGKLSRHRGVSQMIATLILIAIVIGGALTAWVIATQYLSIGSKNTDLELSQTTLSLTGNTYYLEYTVFNAGTTPVAFTVTLLGDQSTSFVVSSSGVLEPSSSVTLIFSGQNGLAPATALTNPQGFGASNTGTVQVRTGSTYVFIVQSSTSGFAFSKLFTTTAT